MKKTLIVLFGLVALGLQAQNIKLQGIVTDSLGVPLEMANVMAINIDQNKMDGYSITGDKGQYALSLKANTRYQLKVSYLGFNPKTIDLTTQSENMIFPIKLEGESVMIEGVEIVHVMPVSIKGDTIVYNADSFTSGTERKLEDVLKKLPGVEVDDEGGIKVEGKSISKIMVEGKDFFDGDTKLGVKNIPADAVDKVQVLRNYNEIDQLKSVTDNQDNLAMNIKLKEGKKNFWFGDILAGTGPDKRYVVNPKLFYYSTKYSLSLISNINNTGEQPMTFSDYLRMTGGFKNMMKKGGSRFSVSSNDLGISMMRNNRAEEVINRFGAGNFSYNPTKSWTLSGFGILSDNRTDMQTWSRSMILNTQTHEVMTTQTSDNRSRVNSEMGMFKLSSNYKPNEKLTFDYDVFFKKSQQKEDNTILTEVFPNIQQTQDVMVYKKQDPTSVSQNTALYYAPNDKHVFSFEGQHLYQDEDPFYNANLGNKPFDLAGYIDGQLRQDINQKRFLKTNKIDLKADYYYALTSKGNLNLTLGNTHSKQDFDSHIFQVLDNGQKNDLDAPQLNNRVDYTFNDVFAGLHYRFMLGKFTINPGFSIHQYFMEDAQQGSSNRRTFGKFLPDLDVKYQIKKSQTLSYNFSLTNNFTDIVQLAEAYVFQGYSSLFKGNRHLENATSQTHSLYYQSFSMFNMEYLNGGINYNRMTDNINSISSFDGINRTSTSFNSNFADETFGGFAAYGRTFARHYKVAAQAGVNWAKNNIMQYNPMSQESYQTARESFSQNYRASFTTVFDELPNIEVGYSVVINDYQDDTFYNSSPFVKLDYYFLKGFSLTADYTLNYYTNKAKTIDNQYDFFNAGLAYQKKDSKWEYKISATNLLDTKSLNSDSTSEFYISTMRYNIQPRYIIFSLKYNI